MSNIYNSDWFGRNSDFTRQGKDRLFWESDNEAYSSFLYPGTQEKIEQMVSDDAKMTSELQKLVKRFALTASIKASCKSSGSYTNGKQIVISSNIEDITPKKKLDVMIGLALHEISHCLYTEFSALKNKNDIQKSLINIIEDELIETQLGMTYPGYANFFKAVKYHMFDKLGHENLLKKANSELEQIMTLFLYIVRYPKYVCEVDKKIMKTYEELFTKIKNILDSHGCLSENIVGKVTGNSVGAASDIYELLKKYIDENQDNQSGENGEGEGSEGDESSEGEGSEGDESSEGESSEKSSKSKSFAEQEREFSSSEINEAIKKIQESCDAGTNPPIDNNIRTEVEAMLRTEQSTKKAARLWRTNGRASSLNKKQIEAEASKFSKIIRNISVNNVATKAVSVVNRFLRNGNLDSRLLASAIQGVPTVYQQRICKNVKKNEPKFAIVLTLDESGSINELQRRTFVTYCTAFMKAFEKDANIEVYVYGHADYLRCYYSKKKKDLDLLYSNYSECGQCESVSYREIINDVKSQTNLPIVMVNFTDSGYCDSSLNISQLVNEFKNKVSFNTLIFSDNYYVEKIKKINNDIYGEGHYLINTTNLKQRTSNINKEFLMDVVNLINSNYKATMK